MSAGDDVERGELAERDGLLSPGDAVGPDQLGGVDLSDEARQVKLAPFFLMEMMELREALDELAGADNHVELGRIERDVAARYEASLEAIAVGLEDSETPLIDVAQSAAKLKYLKRILDEINELSHSTAVPLRRRSIERRARLGIPQQRHHGPLPRPEDDGQGPELSCVD